MNSLSHFLDTEHAWIAIGLAGQLLFTARFLIQWLASEKQKQSMIPIAFWHFSIGGGLLLLLYSCIAWIPYSFSASRWVSLSMRAIYR